MMALIKVPQQQCLHSRSSRSFPHVWGENNNPSLEGTNRFELVNRSEAKAETLWILAKKAKVKHTHVKERGPVKNTDTQTHT